MEGGGGGWEVDTTKRWTEGEEDKERDEEEMEALLCLSILFFPVWG